ncbi:hypothetical protein DFH06DRAFT_1123990 [Mycena polygramma]|nr:hypothetical protein DFH06DRAFT_1123990 [Mycena polygramma]
MSLAPRVPKKKFAAAPLRKCQDVEDFPLMRNSASLKRNYAPGHAGIGSLFNMMKTELKYMKWRPGKRRAQNKGQINFHTAIQAVCEDQKNPIYDDVQHKPGRIGPKKDCYSGAEEQTKFSEAVSQ